MELLKFKLPQSQKIYDTAISDGMPELLSRFLVGQAKHESGNYKSKFAKNYNSYFGYSYNKKSVWQMPKGGTNADNGVPIASYRSIEDSTHEVTHWIKRRQKEGRFPKDLGTITTPMQYAKLLQDCGYYQGWKKYTKEENLNFYAKGIENGMKE